MDALHRVFRGRSPWELLIARGAGQVGLYTRTEPAFAPAVQGQLQAAYPDLRISSIDESAFALRTGETCFWARLRLLPNTTTLVVMGNFLDHEEHQLVDPLSGMFAALASTKSNSLRPLVSIAVKPAGRFLQWRLKRRAGNIEKLRGPLWMVDVRLAVLAPQTHRTAAIVKLHELSGVLGHFLPTGDARLKLSRIREGVLPNRVPRRNAWLLSPAELSLLWHQPTHTVRTRWPAVDVAVGGSSGPRPQGRGAGRMAVVEQRPAAVGQRRRLGVVVLLAVENRKFLQAAEKFRPRNGTLAARNRDRDRPTPARGRDGLRSRLGIGTQRYARSRRDETAAGALQRSTDEAQPTRHRPRTVGGLYVLFSILDVLEGHHGNLDHICQLAHKTIPLLNSS
jgi:hypothetical protein